jgi:hypothetical protein
MWWHNKPQPDKNFASLLVSIFLVNQEDSAVNNEIENPGPK